MSAPYLRIVDEIRQRIRSGQLRPGQRVPSARQITRDWGVAIATATKVLQALAAEGLVHPVVGVGTVVASGVARPSPVDGPMRTIGKGAEGVSRERVVRTAIAVADAEGLPAVTMRRVAAELDVAVMSLYRHVSGKDELIVLMTDEILGEVELPEVTSGGWRAQLEAIARTQWAVGRRHPWLPMVISLTRPMVVPNGMVMTERSMRVVHEAGFDLPTALRVSVSLAGFVMGIGSSMQLDVEAERETGLTSDEWLESQDATFTEVTASGRFPLLVAVGSEPGFDLDLDSIFECGLALLLDGFEQLVSQQAVRTG